MTQLLTKLFKLKTEQTTIRTEMMAGLTSFMTASYIVAVNATILAIAGMPYAAVIIATVMTSLIGCLLMAFWANSPLIVIPGMGDNAFFVFVLVFSLGLTWQQALGVVLLAGIVFAIVALTKSAMHVLHSIPSSLIHAMTTGIGLFISFLGLEKGGLIVSSKDTLVTLGKVGDPHVLTTLMTLLIILTLFIRNVKGAFLIGIVAGTLIGGLLGIVDYSSLTDFRVSFSGYEPLFGAFDFSGIGTSKFWIAVFSLSIVIIFQNMGAQLGMLPDAAKFKRSFQAISFSIVASGLLGCSSTVTAAESAPGIAAGGRTGLTSLTAGLLFIPTLFFIPLLQVIPNSAIAPILIVVGGLMIQKIREIPLNDLTEGFPAYLMIVIIPLSFSVANGIAFGFIAYPLLKIATGHSKEISKPMFVIALLFLIYFVFI